MRKWLLVLTGVLLAAFVAAESVRFHQRSRWRARCRLIDQEHCLLISRGMSQAEVEAILGGPPGDFTTEPVIIYVSVRRIALLTAVV
jgi:hypothetical protein